MRSRPLICALLFALAASAAAAQAQITHEWFRVAPDDEEFAAFFPDVNFRIRRELPFGEGVTLRPASFEIDNRGTLFSVLSFAKSGGGTPRRLDAFVEGFRNALSKNQGGSPSELQFVGESKLGGRAGRQFRVKIGGAAGSARVYETAGHFYVVLALGEQGASGAGERFQNSFALDKSARERVRETEGVGVLTSPPKPAPAPLWPVVGGPHRFVIGAAPRGAEAVPDIDTSSLRGKKLVSGGVLNGKAVAKPMPVYPPIAKAARASGTVTVQILVDEEGYVISASAISGHPLLQHASVVAARQVRFTPTLLEGQPVKVSGVITYNFVLQ
jgi:TonB family protein